MASGLIAFRFAAVSEIVSPFEVEDLETSSLVTEPPRFLIAHSKLLNVRVEFSKKIVMMFLPFSVWLVCEKERSLSCKK